MASMKKRYLKQTIEQTCFAADKMAFVSGPRQCGKTTLAKMLLRDRGRGVYHNWDDIEFRRIWTKDPKQSLPADTRGRALAVFDEVHKARQWKRSLKGAYDTIARPVDILVTGSARLNVYRKGSDSLVGRYYHLRLHPFSPAELVTGGAIPKPDGLLPNITDSRPSRSRVRHRMIEDFLYYGPFPEPFLAQDQNTSRLWRRTRLERVIREDLRDLTRTLELSQIEMLASLLPGKVGGLLSIASLRDDLEAGFGTVKRWLDWLKELYYVFEIKPYMTAIKRSIRKEGKLYMWDFSEVTEESARFENLVACCLLKLCHVWTDSGEGDFELRFLRNKEKFEIDFLITRDGRPWLPVEVKLSETRPSNNWARFMPALPCRTGIQVVKSPGIKQVHEAGRYRILVMSAAELLPRLV